MEEKILMTLGERLDKIENSLAQLEHKVELLWAEYAAKNIDMKKGFNIDKDIIDIKRDEDGYSVVWKWKELE